MNLYLSVCLNLSCCSLYRPTDERLNVIHEKSGRAVINGVILQELSACVKHIVCLKLPVVAYCVWLCAAKVSRDSSSGAHSKHVTVWQKPLRFGEIGKQKMLRNTLLLKLWAKLTVARGGRERERERGGKKSQGASESNQQMSSKTMKHRITQPPSVSRSTPGVLCSWSSSGCSSRGSSD